MTLLDLLDLANTPTLLLKQFRLNRLIIWPLLNANLGVIERIQLLRLEQVQINRERVCNQEPSKRHRHSNTGVARINHCTKHRREYRTTRDRGHEERSTALSVAPEPTQTEREDRGEDAGLKEQHHAQHGDCGVSGCGNGGGDEGNAACKEAQQDEARLDPLHHKTGHETTDGKQCLSNGKKVGAVGGSETGLDFGYIVDEEARDGDLCADVAELCGDAPEEGVLAAERLVDIASCGFGLFRLSGDVGICDFWDAGKE